MTKNQSIFNDLFVLEMANNHMGDVEHGLRVIREMHEVTKNFDIRIGFKLQYRDLDTFIHPDYKNRQDLKYVKRFSETRLPEESLLRLKEEMKKLGMVSICTPFDEASVGLIEKHDFDIIKIASCSLTDWPLLERIAATNKPIIASTAGAILNDIDQVIAFLEHRQKNFCIMHCVGEYPTTEDHLQLNQIDFLKKRYPEIPIGYSTHEDPNNMDAVKIAVGKGAAVFERHVGVATPEYSLNAYSSTPDQVKRWIASAWQARVMCGARDTKVNATPKELSDLKGLQRGVFAKKPILKGEKITTANTYLAIPNIEKQIVANNLSKYTEYVATEDIAENKPVMFTEVSTKNLRGKFLEVIGEVSKIVADAKISLPEKVDFELSHHYGIERFNEWGAAIFSCINREYCKKLIVLLKGQQHPVHRHVKKEETFHILYGDMKVNLNGVEKDYKAGDMLVVERGVKHSFSSSTGAIFEEISTTHYKNDSFYDDKQVASNPHRKTEMTFWSDWLVKPLT